MKRVRFAGVRTNLLQTFRLIHATAEAGVPVAIERNQRNVWRWIDRYFPGLDCYPSLRAELFTDVMVDHHEPRTRIGTVERPLLFPHAILDRCESMWRDRPERMVFAGLMTEDRRRSLAGVRSTLGNDFRVVETDAGRQWPTKAWDEGYYKSLSGAQLAACPNGDFVWTYRFFEATMCGAMPVVEEESGHYDRFKYYRLADDPESWTWRKDWADHNAALVRERLTAPHADLQAAVELHRTQ